MLAGVEKPMEKMYLAQNLRNIYASLDRQVTPNGLRVFRIAHSPETWVVENSKL